MVTLVEMVRVAVNKSIIAQQNLTFDIRPDGTLGTLVPTVHNFCGDEFVDFQ